MIFTAQNRFLPGSRVRVLFGLLFRALRRAVALATPRRRTGRQLSGALVALTVLACAGCNTATTSPLPPSADQPPPEVLQPGDIIRITFPGATGMDVTQQIRRDGKINLNLIGEVIAAGQTPGQLEKHLEAAYAPQLVSKEVRVTVVTSSFSVFVTGAVLKPGKIQPDHPLTAFQAIMEAGGFDYANAKTTAVRVIRSHGTQTETFTLNLQAVLDGKPSKPFYLHNEDTVYVPQKFQLF